MMIELVEQQNGEVAEALNGGLKDVRISSESSPFRHVEVVSREDLKLTEQAAYERGKKEAEANLQQQLDLMKAEYASGKDKEFANFCDTIRSELDGQVPKILESLEKHVVNLAADIAMKIVADLPIDKTMVESVVKDALAKAEQEAEIVVLLHPDDLELLTQGDSELLEKTQGAGNVQFKASTEVTRGGCMLDTHYGTVDARRETKADIIKQAVTA
ncbi:MAG: FliH/SctL family protein [Verrucomicrobiota bacterium]|jgi:flagellar biosynthesis/type III secretory pathway protein FliH|nr:FliH/SctL family protein [Verrucomicrobiota bacterium]